MLLHIICEDRKQAHSVVDELIAEKLVLDAMVSDKLLFKRLKSGERRGEERTLVMGSAKALLFKKSTIEFGQNTVHKCPHLCAAHSIQG